MARNRYDCIDALTRAGISYQDAIQLRRISMTLHRWHELECGDGNDHASWTIARGFMAKGCNIVDGKVVRWRRFEHREDGKPFLERHIHSENEARYEPIPDRERGALKRLGKIMAGYPALSFYVQGDPRGAALYILRPDDVPEGSSPDASYSRGVAVCK